MKKMYRVTWRHELIIEAESDDQAKEIFEFLSLGKLDQEVADGKVYSHEYIEKVSFEDEDYNDIETYPISV